MTDATPPRRPRLALLGEFSAGKSTLANALIGQDVSPVQVTATHAPPICYVGGTGAPLHVDHDGGEEPLDAARLSEMSLETTRLLRVPRPSPVLDLVDLYDMPGSSDPNLQPGVWDTFLPEFDAVFWCTSATQAWRQSEAAIWEGMTPDLKSRSALVVTRIDKVTVPRDRDRLLQRLERETEGEFATILPIDVPLAARAGDDADAQATSGLAALLDVIDAIASGAPIAPTAPATPSAASARIVKAAAPAQPTIAPRRVVAASADPDAAPPPKPRRVSASPDSLF